MKGEDNVNIRFVLPLGKNQTTCSEDLAYAFDQTQDMGLDPIWIHHDEVLDLKYSKMDVFVMDPFDGEAFESIKNSKATIVGPRCLLACLQKKEPVPELPYPMFTAAMKGLIVTSTGFEKEKKAEIQKLIESMSGVYSNTFHDGVTHLIAAVVHSPKYSVAVEKEIPIMTEEWVRNVWKKSQNDNVAATDGQFSRFKCPALMGLNISVSQMNPKDKDLLKKSIESHGGIYSKALDINSTNVLIVPTPEGEKFSYATKWKIPTLNSNWVFDSIEKGYCLESDEYKIEKRNCSTPTKEDVSRLTEVSLCSTIMGPVGDETTTIKVNETVENSGSISVIGKSGIRSTESWFKSLDIDRVIKAGPFLDGCRIFLHGFDDVQKEHLRRVIQIAGATKMSQLIPSVTHMVVKSFAKTKHLKELNLNPYQVTIQWIVESMHLGRMAPESDFAALKMPCLPPLFPKDEKVSTQTEQITQLGNDIPGQYAAKQDDTTLADPLAPAVNQTTTNESDQSQSAKFLTNKTFSLVGLDEETEQELSEWVDEEGGEIVSADYLGILDYLVLPVYGCNIHNFKAKNEVNHLWLSECLDKGEFLNIEYFCKPYLIDTNLKDLLLKKGFFLRSLAEALGAISQETFVRKEKEDTKKSTHLICFSPDGNKYEAALRWKLPVVSKDWVMACMTKMAWISEKPFLLGKSDVFSPDKPLPEHLEELSNNKSVSPLGNEEDLNEISHDIENKNNENSTRYNFNTPINSKTIKNSMLALETPGLDIEKNATEEDRIEPIYRVEISERWCPPPDSQPSPSHLQQSYNHKQSLDDDNSNKISEMKTPEKPFGAFLGNEDPSPYTRKYWKNQYDILISNRTNESERIKLRNEFIELEASRCKRVQERESRKFKLKNAMNELMDPKNLRMQHEATMDFLEAKGLTVLERSEKSFDDLMEDKMNRQGMSWRYPGKRVKLIRDGSPGDNNTIYKLPFEGVKLYVTKKCYGLIDCISNAVNRLGGSILGCYDDENVTHVVFSSNKVNDITKEFRQARSDGKYVVSPDWVFACEEEKRLLNPSKYPHTLNARNSNTINMSATVDSLTTPKACKNFKKPKDEEKLKDLLQDITKMDLNTSKTSSSIKKIQMNMSSTECTTEISSLCEASNQDSIAIDNQTLEHQIQCVDSMKSKENMILSEKENADDNASLANNSEFQSMDIPENMTEEALLQCEEDETNQKYRFMIAGYPDDLKAAFGDLIDSLNNSNISFSNLNCCDPKSTHIIAPKLFRSEKMLCSIASGKMFLHSSYFDECMSHKSIITPLDKYEWGHPNNPFLSQLEDGGFEKSLASASYRWRHKIGSKRKGAFEGIVAIIHTTPKRREAFQRLIEFGGGKVITPNPPYYEPEDATHCFAEPVKVPKYKIDYESLATRGIAVVEPIFINEFLINDPPPPVETYLIDEFKAYWKRR
ncbi:DNA topoisomerase 2-binding protein 1-A [Lepeophtheirus salmonis]|uniref:DNA topoisomerase 2-binding protein 1-A n=1 Tax=Lepeophtheirus salmonis TaxID=72036 RepID=UPI003AF3993E